MVRNEENDVQLPMPERMTEFVGVMFNPALLAQLDRYVEGHKGVKRSDVIRGAVALFLKGNLQKMQEVEASNPNEAEIRQSVQHVADATDSGEAQEESKGE